MKVFEPTVGEWAPRCHVAGGPLRRVVLTNASGKLHNRIRTYSSGAMTCLWRRPARQGCVLNQGVTSLTALRVTPAHPSPVGHPLIRQLPNSNTAKRPARHRVPTLRVEVRPSTETTQPPTLSQSAPSTQRHQDRSIRYRTDRLEDQTFGSATAADCTAQGFDGMPPVHAWRLLGAGLACAGNPDFGAWDGRVVNVSLYFDPSVDAQTALHEVAGILPADSRVEGSAHGHNPSWSKLADGTCENVICIWPFSLHSRLHLFALLHSGSRMSATPVINGQLRSIPGQYR
jgi:hypothetical protein